MASDRARHPIARAASAVVERMEARRLLATPEAEVLGIDDGTSTSNPGDFSFFGDGAPGQALTRTFTLVNRGDADLSISDLKVVDSGGQPASGFSISKGLPAVLEPDSDATFTVKFQSSTPGLNEGTVRFDNNDSDENPYDFAVAANVVLPPLTINGTSGPDTISFDGSSYSVNGSTKQLAGSVTSVVIAGGGGTDTIKINKVREGLDLSVDGGAATDGITVGNGRVDGIEGTVTVTGDGTDALTVNDATAPVDPDANPLTDLTPSHVAIDEFDVDYSGFARVNVNLSDNQDSIQLHSVAPGVTLTVKANGGADMWEVGQIGQDASLADNIQGTAFLDGGSAPARTFDSFSLNNFTETADRKYVLGATSLTLPSVPGFSISYTGIESCSFNLSDASDTVDASKFTGGVEFLMGGGHDNIVGSPQGDSFTPSGEEGVTIHAGLGNDHISGTPGADELFGDGGDDDIQGFGANDTVRGGAGSDLLDAPGARLIFGDAPTPEVDTVVVPTDGSFNSLYFNDVTTGVNVNLMSSTFETQLNRTIKTSDGALPAVKEVFGGSGNDKIVGNKLGNVLGGFGGNDTINGGEGNDFLLGDDGFTGNDALFGEDGNDTLWGEVGNDSLSGGKGNDSVGEDSGEAGFDTIDGGAGNDTLLGGFDDDKYVFADASSFETDTVLELAGGGSDSLDFGAVTKAVTINLASNTLATHTNRTVKTFASGQFINLEKASGGSSSDKITGNTAANTLTGNGGNDTIIGSDGSDSLVGSSGNDSIDGGNGNDTLDGGEGNDKAVGGANDDVYEFASASTFQTDTISESSGGGTDRLDFSALSSAITANLLSDTLVTHSNRTIKTVSAGQFANIENVTGGGGNDKITGNNANNTLVGGGGKDSLFGNNGNDRLEGGTGDDQLTGGTGTDAIFGGDNNDKFFASDGTKDTLDGGSGTDSLGSSDSIDVKSNIP